MRFPRLYTKYLAICFFSRQKRRQRPMVWLVFLLVLGLMSAHSNSHSRARASVSGKTSRQNKPESAILSERNSGLAVSNANPSINLSSGIVVQPSTNVYVAGVSASATTQGQQLSFSFDDPVGDQTGRVDLTGMVFNFDSSAATYTITLTATSANPFVGVFRVNINLLNPDTSDNDSLFSDNQRDFDLATAATTLILSGTNLKLLSWRIGNRVATNDLAFGNPPGTGITAFRSAVTEFKLPQCQLPLFCEDNIAYGPDGFTTIGIGGADLVITDACKGDGKQLVINGAGFVNGAKALLNGVPEKTQFVSSTPVIAFKAGKRAVTGDTLKVRNPDNNETPAFSYARTNCPP